MHPRPMASGQRPRAARASGVLSSALSLILTASLLATAMPAAAQSRSAPPPPSGPAVGAPAAPAAGAAGAPGSAAGTPSGGAGGSGGSGGAGGSSGAAPAGPAGRDLIARGQQLFEDQEYEESVQALSAALLRPSNSKAQKLDIYRLLALNYITLNRKDEAEGAVRGLLSQEPAYELPRSESPRFRDFFAAVRERWEAEGRPGMVEGEPTPVTMQHGSPSQVEPSASIPLSVRVVDPKRRVVDVKLFYRTGAKGKFSEIIASVSGETARATIPASAVKPPLVEYYFEGLDKGGLPIVSRGDAASPLRIAVPEPARGWVLPVAIGGGILGAAAIVGGLALAGVFKGDGGGTAGPGPGGGGRSIVSVSIRE